MEERWKILNRLNICQNSVHCETWTKDKGQGTTMGMSKQEEEGVVNIADLVLWKTGGIT